MTLQESELVPDEFDDPMQHQTIALEYFDKAYEAYLEGADAPFPDQHQILEDRYGACRCGPVYFD
jgi:kinetochore protein NDC80